MRVQNENGIVYCKCYGSISYPVLVAVLNEQAVQVLALPCADQMRRDNMLVFLAVPVCCLMLGAGRGGDEVAILNLDAHAVEPSNEKVGCA